MSAWRVLSRTSPKSTVWHWLCTTHDPKTADQYAKINLDLGWDRYKIVKIIEDTRSL